VPAEQITVRSGATSLAAMPAGTPPPSQSPLLVGGELVGCRASAKKRWTMPRVAGAVRHDRIRTRAAQVSEIPESSVPGHRLVVLPGL